MKLKPIKWTNTPSLEAWHCYILGYSCKIYPNNGKLDACIYSQEFQRPEIQTGFVTFEEADERIRDFILSRIQQVVEVPKPNYDVNATNNDSRNSRVTQITIPKGT